MNTYDIVFYSMNIIVLIIMMYLVFMVAKAGNYKTGYKDGYTSGLSQQTNCMVRHIHDMLDTVVSDGVSKLLDEEEKYDTMQEDEKLVYEEQFGNKDKE